MKNKKEAMCPLFPDVKCPQGHDAADACQVRQHGDYDPMSDMRDYLYMNCAIQRANEQRSNKQKQTIGKTNDE